MRARIIKKGWKNPATGKVVAQGTIVDGRTARLAMNDEAAERWGPKKRKEMAAKIAKTGNVVKEGLD